jgi:hypothetical protein
MITICPSVRNGPALRHAHADDIGLCFDLLDEIAVRGVSGRNAKHVRPLPRCDSDERRIALGREVQANGSKGAPVRVVAAGT